MKRLFIAAVLPVLFFSCAKEEVTNPAFRAPSCEDTTDDGRFEAFTMPESTQFLSSFKNIPDQEVPGVIRYQFLNNRTLYNNGVDYSPYMVYRINQPVLFFAYMPFKNQQEKYYSWLQTSADTSRNDTINLYNLRKLQPQLQPGCYRIYYVFSDSDTTTVLSKGHYDIEVK